LKKIMKQSKLKIMKKEKIKKDKKKNEKTMIETGKVKNKRNEHLKNQIHLLKKK